MKIFMPLLFALSTVEAKKKKPDFPMYFAPKTDERSGEKLERRHPLKVLQSNNKLYCRLVTKSLENPKQGMRYCTRWTNMVTNYAGTFERKGCAFYDPSIKDGGPHPEHTDERGYRFNEETEQWRVRERRDEDDEDIDYDEYDQEDEENLLTDEQECENVSGPWAEVCADTEESNEESPNGQIAVRGGKRPKKPKLSRTQKRARKIARTLGAWCDRHIYNCSGQAKNDWCNVRTANVYKALEKLLPKHVPKN